MVKMEDIAQVTLRNRAPAIADSVTNPNALYVAFAGQMAIRDIRRMTLLQRLRLWRGRILDAWRVLIGQAQIEDDGEW